jgi:hypothetical protein
VIAALRAKGITGPWLVLQWRSLGQAAEVLQGWRCCYDADPVRRAELTRVVERRLADQRYLEARRAHSDRGRWGDEAPCLPLDGPGPPLPVAKTPVAAVRPAEGA